MASAARKPRTAKRTNSQLLANKQNKKLVASAKKHADDERVKRIVERMIQDSPLVALATASIEDEDNRVRAEFGIPANVSPTEQQRERYRLTNQQRVDGLRARSDLTDEHLMNMQVSLVQYHIDVINNPKAKATAKNISAVELRHLAAQRATNRARVELSGEQANTTLDENELDDLLKVYG